MAGTNAQFDQAIQLEHVLGTADPAVLLVAPRLLCRIIKCHRHIKGVGLQVPHRRCYVIERAALLQIVSPEEIGLAPDPDLPATLILIAQPNLGRTVPLPAGEALRRCWRLLFHGRVHAVLEQQLTKGTLTPAGIRRRIERIGQTEFEEIRRVLEQERHLLPPGDDCTTYVEFAALYLGLRCFAPGLIPCYFPGLGDCAGIDALLAADVDTPALLAGLGPECAAVPDPSGRATEDDEGTLPESQGTLGSAAIASSVCPPSDGSMAKLVRKADQAAGVGNCVRAALLRAQASPAAVKGQKDPAWVRAQAELHVLARRLQPALTLSDRETEEWSAALPALLSRSMRGFWTVEARLLYDLQKVCIDHERGFYKADVAGWLLTLGRRPLHRAVPAQQRVRVVRHLRSAARRLLRARLTDPDRRQLTLLFGTALTRNEERLRVEFRPSLQDALDEVNLVPANLPERVARHKLIEELLDRIVERGFLTLGDLRDGLAANQLKLPDLTGVAECVRGDPLLQLNHRLAVTLDGVYHAGEIYLRGLQRLSSLAFGTRPGRFLTRFVVLPYVGAFVLLAGLGEIVELLTGHAATFRQGMALIGTDIVAALGSAPGPGPFVTSLTLYIDRPHRHLLFATPLTVLLLGSFLFALLHLPPFRHLIAAGLRSVGRVLRAVLIDAPAWLLRQPAVRAVLDSWPVLVFRRYALKPLVGAAAGVLVALLAGDSWLTSGMIGIGVFAGAALFFNSRLGRDLEETIADELARSWRRLSTDVFPALFHMVMDFFKMVLDRVERLLYAVDEWLRFKEGDSRLSRIVKPPLGLIWGVLTYIVRFVLNVLIEPQINPVKHFPVVTVAHKLLIPFYPILTHVLEATLSLDRLSAGTLATATIWSIPGLFGFLVWELKENWRLYQANRPASLQPVPIGHHGETMLRLLKPGFHSGTIPRLFAKLRRAQRRGKRKASRKLHEALAETAESIRHFVDREFLELLRQSRGWADAPVVPRTIHLATNRIRVELCHLDNAENSLWLEFAERSGWLVARLTRSGWLGDVTKRQRHVLRTALAGLYKLAGVTIIAEQLEGEVLLPALMVSVREQGLVVWPEDGPEAEAVYDLRNGAVVEARVTQGQFAVDLPALEVRRVLFANVPILWRDWVDVWEHDKAGDEPGKVFLPDVRLLDRKPACT